MMVRRRYCLDCGTPITWDNAVRANGGFICSACARRALTVRNPVFCLHPGCGVRASHVLRSGRMYHYFCDKHYEVYKKLPAYRVDEVEDKLHRKVWGVKNPAMCPKCGKVFSHYKDESKNEREYQRHAKLFCPGKPGKKSKEVKIWNPTREGRITAEEKAGTVLGAGAIIALPILFGLIWWLNKRQE